MGTRQLPRQRRRLLDLKNVLALGLLLSSSAGFAGERPGLTKYRGIHPLWPQTGGFCYIDLPHVHNKSPTDFRVYRSLSDSSYLFVGDPVALGYDGPKYAYFGPHPYPGQESAKPAGAESKGKETDATIYCYLRGPHFHARQPEAGPAFVSKGGAYWFVGTFSDAFERERHNVWMNDAPVLTKYQPPPVTLADAPVGYLLPQTVEIRPPVVNPAARAGDDGKSPPKLIRKADSKNDNKLDSKTGPPAVATSKRGPS